MLCGPPPPGVPETVRGDLGPEALDFALDRLVPAIAGLEAALPLVRDPGAEVWEGLSVTIHEDRLYLRALNRLGNREPLHLFSLDGSRASRAAPDRWFAARDTPRAATTWDAARGGRVVLLEDGLRPRPSYIDPGAVRLLEIALAVGAKPVFSCEGHPVGAYLVVEGDDAGYRLARALDQVGWDVRAFHRAPCCTMPAPETLAERDAAWRATCDGLERLLRLAPDAGRAALAGANLHQPAGADPGPAPRP